MNNKLWTNLIRFVFIFLAQIWIFKHISFSMGGFTYIHFIIYPLAILQLPVKMSRSLILISGFVYGLMFDMIYDSPGVHAFALVFTAYIRHIIIAFLEPHEGYNIADVPTIKSLGLGWMVTYIGVALLIHTFIYFSIEAFSFVFFFEIFLNSIFSFIVSFVVIILSLFIFRTKY